MKGLLYLQVQTENIAVFFHVEVVLAHFLLL